MNLPKRHDLRANAWERTQQTLNEHPRVRVHYFDQGRHKAIQNSNSPISITKGANAWMEAYVHMTYVVGLQNTILAVDQNVIYH